MQNQSCVKKGKILALGELLIDMIPGKEGMHIDDPGAVIKTASGSAGIFACAAAQLGADSGFIGKIGKDSLSHLASKALKEQGVDVSHVILSDEGQIGLAFIEYLPEGRNYQYYRNRSVGSLLCAQELDEDYIAGAYAVHYPGMLLELTEEIRGACQTLVKLAQKHGILISFDPNIRRELKQDKAAADRMLQAVRSADITAPTLDEARIITGESSIGNVLRTMHSMGPKIVCLTRDKDGCVLSMDGQVAFADGIDVNAIDPTGAGDTLAASLCVGLQRGMDIRTLAAFCNCAGTITTMRKGAIGMALPTLDAVNQMMQSGVCHVTVCPLEDVE